MIRTLLLWLLLAAACPLSAQPRTIAHRGFWRTAGSAQNSLASLRKADSIGCYGAEFDVWMAGDGRLVVTHDRTDRETGLCMEEASSRAIRRIRTANGERIPSLRAYLRCARRCPATRLVLEIKALSDSVRERQAVRKIVGMLRRRGLVERTDVISFSIGACLATRELLPDTKVFYLGGDIAPQRIARLGLSGIDYWSGALDKHPEWIAEAHALGLEVNVWTVNDDDAMRRFIDAGADYITTDRPDRLLQITGEATAHRAE